MIPVEVAAVLVILTISGFRMNHIFNYDLCAKRKINLSHV